MINSISKPKLPKGYTYILKSSQLDDLLKQNNFTIHVDLNFWFPQETGSILETHFWLPNSNIPYKRLYVRAGALPLADLKTAKEKMITTVLPDFMKWIDYYLKLPATSTEFNTTPYFKALYKNNSIEIYS